MWVCPAEVTPKQLHLVHPQPRFVSVRIMQTIQCDQPAQRIITGSYILCSHEAMATRQAVTLARYGIVQIIQLAVTHLQAAQCPTA